MATDRANKVMQALRRVALHGGAPEWTDGQLLGRFVEGRDEAAFEALVRRHGPMVLGVCRRLLRHGQDAEDAFQAVFIVLVRKAASVRPRDMVGNWLYGVAYQTARKARATAARRQARERQVAEMPEPEASEMDSFNELLPLLDRELSRLPDKYRAPLVLCELEGKTYKEAARRLGCPEGTVSCRLSRGRALLAKRLARCGLAVTAGAVAAALSQTTATAGVPSALLASTVKTATLLAAGGTAAGVVSGPVAALTQGVLKAMFLSKLQTVAAVGLTLALIGLGVGMLAGARAAADPANPHPLEAASPDPKPADAATAHVPFDQFYSAAPVDGEVFLLVNTAGGQCLSILNGSRDAGRRVVQGPQAADAGPNERWKVVKVGDYFKLINVNSGKVLADPEASKEKNAQMIQWDDMGLEDQQWQFVPVGRHYSLKNRASGLLLEAPPTRNDPQARNDATRLWMEKAPETPGAAPGPTPRVEQRPPPALFQPEPGAAPGPMPQEPNYLSSPRALIAAPGVAPGPTPQEPNYLPAPPGFIAAPLRPWYIVQDPGAAVPPAVIQSGATGRPDQVWFIQWVPGNPKP